MKTVYQLQELGLPVPTVATIGNFDGVHLGHRAIFRRVVAAARDKGWRSAVITFLPHPLKVVAPARAPKLINTPEEKERLVGASLVDLLVSIPFDETLSALEPSEFVKRILVDQVGVRHLIVGYDYAFGKGRGGNVSLLTQLGQELGFTLEVLPPVKTAGQIHASTAIRRLVTEGDVSGVVPFLGRHFNVEGIVVHGAKRGRTIGFPTANIETEKELIPKPGVYAVKVKLGERLLDGVVNIGCNPTFCIEGTSVEVYLFDFQEEIYGERLRIYFLQRLRDELRFPSVDALISAIRGDVAQAREILTRTQVIEYREYLEES